MRRIGAVVLVAATLAAAGCGGGGTDPSKVVAQTADNLGTIRPSHSGARPSRPSA